MLPALLAPLSFALGAPARAATDAAVDPDLPVEVGPFDLIRVEGADRPGALASSATHSVVAEVPAEGAWWVEEPPVVDRVEEDELAPDDAPPVPDDVTLDAGAELEGVGTWRAWDADAAVNASAWHAQGVDGSYPDGSRVKVAIFDVQWENAELHAAELGDVETHDCWAHRSCEVPIDTLRPRYSFEAGSHGVACAELIRDLAPGVELHLVRVNGVVTMDNAVDWAIREGIDVVSMSMSFFNNSFYDGSGPVADLMDRLQAGGVLMVTSAGNYAEEHWRGPYQDRDGDGVHEFFDDRRTLPIYLRAGTRSLALSWDEFHDCGRNDFDAYMYDADGRVVGRAERDQPDAGGSCEPVERLTVTAEETGWYYLDLVKVHGPGDVLIDVMARGGDTYRPVAASSLTDPGSHPAVLTVGAVRAEGYATNPPEAFSSHGPTTAGHPKPDLAGPDGVTTSVYGPMNFYGTSASTPVVAATVALLMSAEPGITPFEAADRLQGHLIDEGRAWQEQDEGLGRGKVRLRDPDAVPSSCWGPGVGAFLLPLVWPLAALRRRRDAVDAPPGRDR
ncbi:MAG: S8 family serine peptidase [Alphaproteobacteria bacterium]|nr:S8 family serine peptidase [Alphaproteobacteria bacterium]